MTTSGRSDRQPVAWRLFQLLTVLALSAAAFWVLRQWPYRIDVDVYRMGARAWLDGRSLYSDDALFHTQTGLDLPFTYPPLAAIFFSPLAWLSLPAAAAAITYTTLVVLVVATAIVLAGLDVRLPSAIAPESVRLQRVWLAAVIVAAAVVIEPIRSNFSFGQINAVLMTLVIADCVPRRTPWPRGTLLGLAVALKLTPGVFLLYFLLRRDYRAAVTTVVSFLTATALGFMLAWRDSWQYWTATVRHTDRIGGAALNTNQNVAGALARLPLDEQQRFLLWGAASLAVLAVTVWATRRVLRVADQAGEPVMALICVALFGLVVSPVSWSHHWVWVLPAVVTTGVLAQRRGSVTLGVLSAGGVVLTALSPLYLLPEHHEASAPWWHQFIGLPYVWWALAVIVAAGATSATDGPAGDRVSGGQPAAVSG